MNRKHSIKVLTVAVIGFAALALPVLAAQPLNVDFANETAGGEPKSLVPVVGIWRIENAGGKNALAVDGRQWKEGQSSAGIAGPIIAAVRQIATQGSNLQPDRYERASGSTKARKS
jgi:hypothetical protein